MKGSLIIAGALCALAMPIALSSCGAKGSGQDSKGQASIKEFAVDQTIKSSESNYLMTVEGDTVYINVSASIHWPEKIGDAQLTALRDSLALFCFGDTLSPSTDINRAISRFLANTSTFTDVADGADITAVDSIPAGMDYMRSWYSNVSASIEELNENMVTYNVTSSIYLGGAHPGSASLPFTYDLRTGTVLTADNMFVPGSRDALMQLITNSLAHQLNVEPSQLESAGIFVNQLTSPGLPFIEGGAVVFRYNQYDIAPYSMGTIDVTVYPNEIDSLLTPEVRSLVTEMY